MFPRWRLLGFGSCTHLCKWLTRRLAIKSMYKWTFVSCTYSSLCVHQFLVLLFETHCCVLSHLDWLEVPSRMQRRLKTCYLRIDVSAEWYVTPDPHGVESPVLSTAFDFGRNTLWAFSICWCHMARRWRTLANICQNSHECMQLILDKINHLNFPSRIRATSIITVVNIQFPTFLRPASLEGL